MIHGDIVTITSQGILVHEKALQPLGIFDQSTCWGVWTASPYAGQPHHEYPNLIISPIHPSSWPFLIRLEIAILDKEGSLAWICQELNKNDLSILFLECTTTGFNHALCNVIAESTLGKVQELKNKKEEFDKVHPYVRIDEGVFKEAQNIANEISASMLNHAREIENNLNNKAVPGNGSFLQVWELEKKKGLFLYNIDEVVAKMGELNSSQDTTVHRKYIDDHFPKTVTAQYMPRLAYFSMYGGGIDVPFSLRYQANSALLKLERDEIFSSEGIRIFEESKEPFVLGPMPRPAISTFNSQEKYLRLKPITSKILEHTLTRISVEFRVEQQPNRAAEGSKGFLRWISEQLQKAKVNLLHVSNKWTRYEYSMEAGLISFTADIPKGSYRVVEEAIRSFNHNKPPELKSVSIREVSVYEFPHRKLFVSIHFGHPRESDIIRIIHQVAKECGFEGTTVETYVDPATRTIMEQISTCHAFLQLLLFRADDDPQNTSFSWLDFEYGVASGKGIPTIRLVDIVRVSYDWWKNRITTNPDQRVREFRTDASQEMLTTTIRKAIEELAQELLRRQQEIG